MTRRAVRKEARNFSPLLIIISESIVSLRHSYFQELEIYVTIPEPDLRISVIRVRQTIVRVLNA
jgi:hypothetical protein